MGCCRKELAVQSDGLEFSNIFHPTGTLGPGFESCVELSCSVDLIDANEGL
ncbi:MAG: hypothetical protein QOJ99_4694 [Bryobacterales bacterium]|jgi:hypothetical protein|nr:hypothetical protein [Bryobacterales bacterium]